MILYINACVREESRTHRIAQALLEKLGGPYQERNLNRERMLPLSAKELQTRTEMIAKRDYSHPMFAPAKQFAAADKIVIAAPYWDLSFPSVLKVYLEHIYVTGIVSEYTEQGVPRGLCRANELYYVTTAGGPYLPDYSYGYIKSLATVCFGIPKTALIKAEMLDVQGYDPEAIVQQTIRALDRSIYQNGERQ